MVAAGESSRRWLLIDRDTAGFWYEQVRSAATRSLSSGKTHRLISSRFCGIVPPLFEWPEGSQMFVFEQTGARVSTWFSRLIFLLPQIIFTSRSIYL